MRIKAAHIALFVSILALAVSLFTAVQVSKNDNAALIDALMAQNQSLQEQIDALGGSPSVRPGKTELPAGLTLTATPLDDGSGADIHLTLEAGAGSDVRLRIMLGTDVITEAPCVSDGSLLMATARIPADNGYTYSIVIDSEAIILASPDDPVYPELVYLADALSAYCTLVVGDADVQGNVLTLRSGFVHIHTPQLGGGDALTCAEARLVLKNGDAALAVLPVTPTPEEEPGSYACNIVNATFALPALAQGEAVDLYLEVTLSDGQVLTHCAATWYAVPGGFSMAAG